MNDRIGGLRRKMEKSAEDINEKFRKARIRELEAKLAERERREFVCESCGLRKDAEVYGYFEKVDT